MSQSKTTRKKRTAKRYADFVPDRHVLYEASVQCVDADLDFFERIYRRKRRRPFHLLREDFCGTAALACTWVARHPENRAWGVDLHLPTLDWGRRYHLARLGEKGDRVTLHNENVLTVSTPAVDVVAALNFSYMTFKDRGLLRRYFECVRRALRPDGIFFIDVFGGTESTCELDEDRKIRASTAPDGSPVPPFVYQWEQASYNPIDHHIRCHIHFLLPDGERMRRAFTYDWRLWTVPELREVLEEAGFARTEVYLESWDDDLDDTDGIFRRRSRYDNEGSWVGYVIGLR